MPPSPSFLISFNQLPARDFIDPHPDYEVLLNGEAVSKIFYDFSGYSGSIPDIRGRVHAMQDKALAEWWELSDKLNMEAAQKIQKSVSDNARVVKAHHTLDKDIMSVFNGEDEKLVRTEEFLMAAKVFGQRRNVPWNFCEEVSQDRGDAEITLAAIASIILRKNIDDPELLSFINAVVDGKKPQLTPRLRNGIEELAAQDEDDEIISVARDWFLFWTREKYPETQCETTGRWLEELRKANVWLNDPSPDKETQNRRAKALELDDAISLMKGFTDYSRGDGRLGYKARVLLVKLLKICEDMGSGAPVTRVDSSVVRSFLPHKMHH